MKAVSIIIAILLTIGISLEANTAIAEKRVKIFEMAESGQTFEFPMSPEEIASENAENARLAVVRQAKLNKPKERKKVIEMGESGQTVEFPMSLEEIAAEDADNAKIAASRQASLTRPQKQTLTFEFAESGITIEFPVSSSENQK
jgi:hypothetical protein